MESLNTDYFSNMFQHFDREEWQFHLEEVSSKWNNFLEQLNFNEIKSFENVNKLSLLSSPGFYTHLPLLRYREGLNLINRVAPYLTSIIIRPHFAGECGYLLFGQHLLKMNNFDLSNLFEIIYEKCVNLEDVSIDMPNMSSTLMAKMVEKNPKLKVLKMMRSAIKDLFPQGATIPSLEQIFLYGPYDKIKGFSSLSKKMTLIDMSHCCITPEDLPELMQEILQHKKSLKCLRINLTIGYSRRLDCSALAALATCNSLTELKIHMDEDEERISGHFFKDIINGCPNLEIVHLTNVDIDEKTYYELMTMVHLQEAQIDEVGSDESSDSE